MKNLLLRFSALGTSNFKIKMELVALLIGDILFRPFMRDKIEACQSANAELTWAKCRFDIGRMPF
jgi:hypothetical protein